MQDRLLIDVRDRHMGNAYIIVTWCFRKTAVWKPM